MYEVIRTSVAMNSRGRIYVGVSHQLVACAGGRRTNRATLLGSLVTTRTYKPRRKLSGGVRTHRYYPLTMVG